MTEQLYDPGLQPERTALAWTRTALALLTAAAIVARLAFGRVGPAAVVVILGSVPVALGILVASARRYRTAQRALSAESALPDARLPAAVVLLILQTGLVELAYLLA